MVDLEIDTTFSAQHDLTNMLNNAVEEEEIILMVIQKIMKSDLIIAEQINLKLLMFRDSFTHAMLPFLKENFGESIYIWHPTFAKEVIEREQPDIVVYEIIERDLEFIKPSPLKQ